MSAYYNEFDPYPAQWLRNLSDAGHIAKGTVDERSIKDVNPEDLSGYRQAHFFAGIGGWSLALRLAGWPDDAPVWTGSCPCQPFSTAGKRLGAADERHLWPAFFRLIRQCRPAIVFGEQVAGKSGRLWLDAVSADLEGEGYAVGSAELCAAGVGAPHERQRLYWVAYSMLQNNGLRSGGVHLQRHVREEGFRKEGANGPSRGRGDLFWSRKWLSGNDGRKRFVEPGTFPLAHGVPARVGRLRAYGNAIVPQVAATFIRSLVEAASAPGGVGLAREVRE